VQEDEARGGGVAGINQPFEQRERFALQPVGDGGALRAREPGRFRKRHFDHLLSWQLPVAGCQLPVASCRWLLTTDNRLSSLLPSTIRLAISTKGGLTNAGKHLTHAISMG